MRGEKSVSMPPTWPLSPLNFGSFALMLVTCQKALLHYLRKYFGPNVSRLLCQPLKWRRRNVQEGKCKHIWSKIGGMCILTRDSQKHSCFFAN